MPEDDNDKVRLRVDRLARAMETARMRAGGVAPKVADEPPPLAAPRGPGHASGSPPADDRPAGPAGPAPRAEDRGQDLTAHEADAPKTDAEPVRSAAPAGQRLILMPDQLYAPPDGGDWPGSSNPDLAAEASSATPLEAERPLLRPAVPATSSATVDRPSAAPVLLSLAGVSTDIGPYHILDDVSFDVPVRGVTMLLGRNGAGKTTTLRTIMGLRQPRSGHIRFDGEDISGWPAHRIARAGLGYVPEDMGIFGSLSVAENMILAARSGPIPADRLDWLFSVFPALRTFWNAPAGTLSGGQKQMLAVARAMVERRRLYLIDEPTKGLAPAIMATLVKAIRDLKLQGAAVLLVEQNFAVARELGDRCVVLDDGRVAWSGSMTAIADDPDLQARLLGFDLERT